MHSYGLLTTSLDNNIDNIVRRTRLSLTHGKENAATARRRLDLNVRTQTEKRWRRAMQLEAKVNLKEANRWSSCSVPSKL